MAEDQNLKIRFDDPEHGRIALTMDVGEDNFQVVVTYTPFDCISELAVALNQVLSGEERAAVRSADGPIQYEMSFDLEDAQISVTFSHVRAVLGGLERESLFNFSEETGKVLVAFWRALRELQGRYEPNEYQRRWRHPFPTREMEVFTERMTVWKSNQHPR